MLMEESGSLVCLERVAVEFDQLGFVTNKGRIFGPYGGCGGEPSLSTAVLFEEYMEDQARESTALVSIATGKNFWPWGTDILTFIATSEAFIFIPSVSN